MSNVTIKQMCEHIVRHLNPQKPSGEPYTPEEIWNYSPRGELWEVFEMYDLSLLKEADKLNYEGLKELYQRREREFAEWVAKATNTEGATNE